MPEHCRVLEVASRPREVDGPALTVQIPECERVLHGREAPTGFGVDSRVLDQRLLGAARTGVFGKEQAEYRGVDGGLRVPARRLAFLSYDI